jgi:hypothetical protein
VRGPWHIEGALLGLDLCLAETWLPRVSTRPLAEPPSVDKVDRRTFAEAVTLMDGAALDDRAMASIAQALRKGRALVASAGGPAGVAALTATLPIDESRRALLSWSVGRIEAAAGAPATARSAAFAGLSTTDLLRLGSRDHETSDPDRGGAPARPQLGCPCLRFPPLGHEEYMGHLSRGILAGGVADLPLRVAELLDDAGMPASLAPHVLAPATLDLVNRAASEYPDDLRGIRAHVHALSRDDLDTWLGLLTTEGPLVPLRGQDVPLSGNER